MKKNIKNILLTLSGLALITGCLKGSFESNYSSICGFEFGREMKDSVYFAESFMDGGLVFANARNASGELIGGFALSKKCDKIYKPDHRSRSLFCVADTTALGEVFSVYVQNPDKKVPEKDIVFASTQYGIIVPKVCFINNTNDAANIILYGRGDDVLPFAEGNYLKLTVTAFLDGKEKEKKAEAYLANYTEKGLMVLRDWTEFKLNELGDFDYLDFQLESNRESDIPMSFCMDNMISQINIKQ